MPVLKLLESVIDHVKLTDDEFRTLYHTGKKTYPIPFFGDLEHAEVITVGVNPSYTAFSPRFWNQIDSAEILENSLLKYFKNDSFPKWFQKWDECLNLLNCPYVKNSAHLDLSPRITKSMGSVHDRELFLRMVECDLKWFPLFLEQCSHMKLILMAGSIAGKSYVCNFLKAKLPKPWKLIQHTRYNTGPRGWYADYELVNNGKSWPVFFCSSGPSDRNNNDLLRKAFENRLYDLKKYIKRRSIPEKVSQMSFILGKSYTRSDINKLIGGGVQDFLPHKKGKIVCGCFRKDINPEAPDIILPGKGKNIIKWSKQFCIQTDPIPNFIRRNANEWEYIGNYKVDRWSEDWNEIVKHAGSRKALTSRVIFLKKV